MTLFTVLFSLALNILYFVISQKIRLSQFFRYFLGFITYTLIVFFILYFLKFNFIFEKLISFLFIYTLFFISLFLSMSTKYIKSPTYLIFKSLKKESKRKRVIKYLESQNVFKKRLDDLVNQKIIRRKKNKIYLRKNLNFVLNLIFQIKVFFNLKSEG
jgi:hypothetical protein